MAVNSENRALAWIALAAALALGIALRLAHHSDMATRTPDERVYTHFASRIADDGFGAMPQVFAEYEADPGSWDYPAPTRIGYVATVAAVMKATGTRDATAGALVSLACSILSLFLVAWIGLRFFHPWVAASAVVFLAFSFAELGMARRAWRDLFFGVVSLMLVYVTCEISRKPRRMVWYPLFLFFGLLLLLTKENGIIAYGVCGLWLFAVVLRRERWAGGFALLLFGGVLSGLLALAVWTLLAGNMSVALSVLNHTLHASVNSTWAQQFASGPWYQFLYLLWLVGPLTAALALVGTIVVLRRLFFGKVDPAGWLADSDACALVALMALVFICFAAFFPNLQYLRNISPSDSPYCLLAGIGLCVALAHAKRWLSESDFRILLLLAVLAVGNEGIRDYRLFTSIVVRTGMEDLPVGFIRSALHR